MIQASSKAASSLESCVFSIQAQKQKGLSLFQYNVVPTFFTSLALEFFPHSRNFLQTWLRFSVLRAFTGSLQVALAVADHGFTLALHTLLAPASFCYFFRVYTICLGLYRIYLSVGCRVFGKQFL